MICGVKVQIAYEKHIGKMSFHGAGECLPALLVYL